MTQMSSQSHRIFVVIIMFIVLQFIGSKCGLHLHRMNNVTNEEGMKIKMSQVESTIAKNYLESSSINTGAIRKLEGKTNCSSATGKHADKETKTLRS